MTNWVLAIALAIVLGSMWFIIYGIDFIQWCYENPASAILIALVIGAGVGGLVARRRRKKKVDVKNTAISIVLMIMCCGCVDIVTIDPNPAQRGILAAISPLDPNVQQWRVFFTSEGGGQVEASMYSRASDISDIAQHGIRKRPILGLRIRMAG